MRLYELFDIKNGIATTDLQISSERLDNSVPFLRPASTQQRTLSGFVKRSDAGADNIYPIESIFVSTNGEGSHSFAYVSRFEFAANSDVSILIPRKNMPIGEKLFYARCITMNRWKFSYGRKPKGNRLKSLDLPSILPDWISSVDPQTEINNINFKFPNINSVASSKVSNQTPTLVSINSLFEVIYGTNLELVGLELEEHGINFVSRTSKNNGVSAKVKTLNNIEPIQGPVLTVAGGGSVLETFLQTVPFYSGRDLFYLKPREFMTEEELLFYCACIRANKFRYSYGRQANRTLKDLLIPEKASIPSWVYGTIPNIIEDCKKLIAL